MVYFVATPIGNLSELSPRAVEVLSSVSAILCEDTRHSRTLLNRYNITSKLYSYHKFNEQSMVSRAIEMATAGDIAVISDAGMPCINDPGTILVNALKSSHVPYTVISGPCALVNAFVLSGYNAPFTYLGFLPDKLKDRTNLINSFRDVDSALIIYVSVHDLDKDRQFLHGILGDRPCALVRELTKLHEEVIHTSLSQPFDNYKGEFVLVVDRGTENTYDNMTAIEHLQYNLDSGLSRSDAVKLTARQRGVNKNEIYKLTIE